MADDVGVRKFLIAARVAWPTALGNRIPRDRLAEWPTWRIAAYPVAVSTGFVMAVLNIALGAADHRTPWHARWLAYGGVFTLGCGVLIACLVAAIVGAINDRRRRRV